MGKSIRPYVEMHFAVFLYGFAAILGVLISVSAVAMVWWRLLMAVGVLALYLPLYREIKELSKRQILTFLGIGTIIGIHWIAFYGSVKLANASVALISFSSAPFFTALVEPIVTRTSWKKIDFIFGILIIPAMYLILASLDFSMIWGAISGILSALFAAIFSSYNKKYIDDTSSYTLFTLEMIGAFILLSLIIPVIYLPDATGFMPSGLDWIYLLVLVVFVTILGFILNLRALKHLSAFTSNFIISLEPVYGIFLAIFILNEHRELNLQFYVGVFFMMALIMIYPFFSKKYNQG